MGPAETAGIVVITVAAIQGLIGLVKYLIDKRNGKRVTVDDTDYGLTEKQSAQLYAMHEIITLKDEGLPLVYFPRQSMGDVQKEIATQLRSVAEMQLKMLGIIERMKEDVSK